MITFNVGKKFPVHELAFLPGTRLVAAKPEMMLVGIWDIDDGGGPPVRTTATPVAQGYLAANARFVFLASSGHPVAWDVATGAEQPLVGEPNWWTGVCLSSDGTRLLVSRNVREEFGPPRPSLARVEFWDVSGDTPHMLWRTPEPVRIVRNVRFLPGGEHFLTRTSTLLHHNEFRVGSLADGSWMGEPRPWPDGRANGYLPSADGRFLFALDNSAILVHDWATATPLARIKNPDGRGHFAGLALHPSGKFFATANLGGAVRFWDAATWESTARFDWNLGKARCVAFSPDGLLCAAGGDKGQIVVWDVD